MQLPLFNEMYVVERLLDAVVGIRYPRDRFQVQVLDDSPTRRRRSASARWPSCGPASPTWTSSTSTAATAPGSRRAPWRTGCSTAKGELILIFDADFLPQPDMLERTVDHFVDPKVAVVQCRWKHLNRDFSALTEAQALLLDGHFVMEHAGRAWSGRFFNFNGTAGLWRRAAIAEAGGWQHDTLTEDMDLSYRAQLLGWKFVYVPEVAAPAELPVEMSAFKAQQFRWAKGSIQVAKKLLPRILRSNATWAQKSEAFFHLANNFAYPLLLLLSLLLLPNLWLRTKHGVREVLTDRPAAVLRHDDEPGGVLPGDRRRRSPDGEPRREARFPLVGAGPPAAGAVAGHRPVRQPDPGGAGGGAGQGHRVRAHAQARHPRQAGVLEQQEVPGRPLADAR